MSTTAPSSEESPSQVKNSGDDFWRSFARFWSSVKLGIVLMLSIAIASILGTIVPQGDPSAIQSLKSSEGTKQFLLAIGANNVYYSGWFLSLLATFFLNLLVATWVMVLPRLRVSLRKPPEVVLDVQERHHENKVYLPQQSIDQIAQVLKSAGYRVYQARSGGVVGHKGRFSRFAPLITHLGLFAILIGGIASGMTSFKAQVPLFPGETLPAHQMVTQLAQPRGVFAGKNYDWTIRLDKFWMDYYSNERVKQFYSEVSILEGDHVVAHKKIWVNEPFVHDGVWFYQAFWGVGGAMMVIDGKPNRISLRPGEEIGLQGHLSKLVDLHGKQYLFYLPNERQPLTVMRFNGGGVMPQPLAEIQPGGQAMVDGIRLQYKGPALYSGIQSKADPGIPIVYAGFIILTLGSGLAFFALRQVWVNPSANGFLLSGKANRGHVSFQQELVRVATQLGANLHDKSHRV